MHRINSVDTVVIKWNNMILYCIIIKCWTLIEQVLRLPGAVSPNVLHNASLRITLTAPEVVDTGNRATPNLPFLFNPNSIAKMQSWSLVTVTAEYIILLLSIVEHFYYYLNSSIILFFCKLILILKAHLSVYFINADALVCFHINI